MLRLPFPGHQAAVSFLSRPGTVRQGRIKIRACLNFFVHLHGIVGASLSLSRRRVGDWFFGFRASGNATVKYNLGRVESRGNFGRLGVAKIVSTPGRAGVWKTVVENDLVLVDPIGVVVPVSVAQGRHSCGMGSTVHGEILLGFCWSTIRSLLSQGQTADRPSPRSTNPNGCPPPSPRRTMKKIPDKKGIGRRGKTQPLDFEPGCEGSIDYPESDFAAFHRYPRCGQVKKIER
jgi:hypothetical protein